jgi:hypothetical protein
VCVLQGSNATTPLNVLPPNEKAWPRVEIARYTTAAACVYAALQVWKDVVLVILGHHAILLDGCGRVGVNLCVSEYLGICGKEVYVRSIRFVSCDHTLCHVAMHYVTIAFINCVM